MPRLYALTAAFALVLGLSAAPAARSDTWNADESFNWSGYVRTGLAAFKSVSAEWIVPVATPSGDDRIEHSSHWIGIGGMVPPDPTLIQAGTESSVDENGIASYGSWWEIIPSPAITAPLDVSPGDRVKVTISESLPLIWTISMENLTTGRSFVQTTPYVSAYSTVEWIVETPISSDTGGFAPLPMLSTVKFNNLKVNGAPPKLVPSEQIQLVDGNEVISRPSAPSATGDAFNVCTYATTCAAP